MDQVIEDQMSSQMMLCVKALALLEQYVAEDAKEWRLQGMPWGMAFGKHH